MISSFKIFEKKSSEVLIVVDVQEEFEKFFPDKYVNDIFKLCKNHQIVYQIYDTINATSATYKFPNEQSSFEKQYGGKIDYDSLDYIIDSERDDVEKRLDNKSFKKGDSIQLTNGDTAFFIDGQHDWFFCTEELLNLFTRLSNAKTECILVGGANHECLEDIYVTMLAVGCNVSINYEYVYPK
jgi:hypothetical protein